MKLYNSVTRAEIAAMNRQRQQLNAEAAEALARNIALNSDSRTATAQLNPDLDVWVVLVSDEDGNLQRVIDHK